MPSSYNIKCKCGELMNFSRELSDRAHTYRCQSCNNQATVLLNREGGVYHVDKEPTILKNMALSLADIISKKNK